MGDPQQIELRNGAAFQALLRLFDAIPVARVRNPVLWQSIQPVYEVNTQLQTIKGASEDLDISASAGAYVTNAALTVPGGTQWQVSWIHRGTSPSQSVVRATIGGQNVYQLFGRGTDHAEQFMNLLLSVGDSIGVQTTGDAGATLNVEIAYVELEVL